LFTKRDGRHWWRHRFHRSPVRVLPPLLVLSFPLTLCKLFLDPTSFDLTVDIPQHLVGALVYSATQVIVLVWERGNREGWMSTFLPLPPTSEMCSHISKKKKNKNPAQPRSPAQEEMGLFGLLTSPASQHEGARAQSVARMAMVEAHTQPLPMPTGQTVERCISSATSWRKKTAERKHQRCCPS